VSIIYASALIFASQDCVTGHSSVAQRSVTSHCSFFIDDAVDYRLSVKEIKALNPLNRSAQTSNRDQSINRMENHHPQHQRSQPIHQQQQERLHVLHQRNNTTMHMHIGERLAAATTGTAAAQAIVPPSSVNAMRNNNTTTTSAAGHGGVRKKETEAFLNHWSNTFLHTLLHVGGEMSHSQRALVSNANTDGHNNSGSGSADQDGSYTYYYHIDSESDTPPLHQVLCYQENNNKTNIKNNDNKATTTRPSDRQVLRVLDHDRAAASQPMKDWDGAYPLHKVLRRRDCNVPVDGGNSTHVDDYQQSQAWSDDVVLGILQASASYSETKVLQTPDPVTGLLPLHAALLNQSSEIVIYSLVNLFPAAATLPMPLACHLLQLQSSQEPKEAQLSRPISSSININTCQEAALKVVEEEVVTKVGVLPFHGAQILGFSVQLVDIFFDLLNSDAERKRKAVLNKIAAAHTSIISTDKDNHGTISIPVPMLPLHYVIHHKLQDTFILQVLQSDPDAARHRYYNGDGDDGDLPLHRAIRHQLSDRVIMTLLRAFGHATKIRSTKTGRLPIHEAAKNPKSTPKLIRALIRRYPQSLTQPDYSARLPHYLMEPTLCEESIDLLCGTSLDDAMLLNEEEDELIEQEEEEETEENTYIRMRMRSKGRQKEEQQKTTCPPLNGIDLGLSRNHSHNHVHSQHKKEQGDQKDNEDVTLNISQHVVDLTGGEDYDDVDSIFEVEFKRTNIAHWYDPHICDDDDADNNHDHDDDEVDVDSNIQTLVDDHVNEAQKEDDDGEARYGRNNGGHHRPSNDEYRCQQKHQRRINRLIGNATANHNDNDDSSYTSSDFSSHASSSVVAATFLLSSAPHQQEQEHGHGMSASHSHSSDKMERPTIDNGDTNATTSTTDHHQHKHHGEEDGDQNGKEFNNRYS
jgi:hypothetical protein